MSTRRTDAKGRAMSLAALIAAMSGAAVAQDAAVNTSGNIQEIVVSGSRLPTDISSVPGSISVLTEAELEKQRTFSNDIGQILAAAVPGLGAASPGSASNYDVTLRGRKPAVFIDGVPITTPLRDGGREMRTVMPGALQRIEVIRGSTALYGLGGAGGIINYVTRSPKSDRTEFYSSVSAGGSLTHLSGSGHGNVEQAVSGRAGRFSYLVNGGLEQYSSFFDADGDRMAPNPGTQGGLADTRSHNILAKAGFDLAENQVLQFAVNDYNIRQDTGYRAGNGVLGQVKTPTLVGPIPEEYDMYTDNLLAYLTYTNTDVLGGSLNAQAYYGDNANRFRWLAGSFGIGDQTQVFSEKRGLRLDLNTPVEFLNGTSLLWGLDLGQDKTHSTLAHSRQLLVPYMDQLSWAPFVQLEVNATDRLQLRGGVRHEDISLDVSSFRTVYISPALPGGNDVQGGTLDYSKTVYNIGAVFDLTDSLSVFAAFSQGFSVADIGRILLFMTEPSVRAFQPEAQVIDSYEAGFRANYGRLRASLTGFISKSDLGSTFNAITFEVIRSKEEVWGGEATLDFDVSETMRLGATYSYQKGERDANNDGKVETSLDTSRIAAPKATAYFELEPAHNWLVRLQAMYSDSQNLFPNTVPTFGTAPINAFTIVDLSVSAPVGPGQLSLALNNLLNEDYYLPSGVRNALPTTYIKGPGASATLSYSVRY